MEHLERSIKERRLSAVARIMNSRPDFYLMTQEKVNESAWYILRRTYSSDSPKELSKAPGAPYGYLKSLREEFIAYPEALYVYLSNWGICMFPVGVDLIKEAYRTFPKDLPYAVKLKPAFRWSYLTDDEKELYEWVVTNNFYSKEDLLSTMWLMPMYADWRIFRMYVTSNTVPVDERYSFIRSVENLSNSTRGSFSHKDNVPVAKDFVEQYKTTVREEFLKKHDLPAHLPESWSDEIIGYNKEVTGG